MGFMNVMRAVYTDASTPRHQSEVPLERFPSCERANGARLGELNSLLATGVFRFFSSFDSTRLDGLIVLFVLSRLTGRGCRVHGQTTRNTNLFVFFIPCFFLFLFPLKTHFVLQLQIPLRFISFFYLSLSYSTSSSRSSYSCKYLLKFRTESCQSNQSPGHCPVQLCL